MHELDDSPQGFQWIDFHDADASVVAFFRRGSSGAVIIFIVNATPIPRPNYKIGVPESGYFREILNTDASVYGGSNYGNLGGTWALNESWQGFNHSLVLNLPPLSVIAFQPVSTIPEPIPVVPFP
jgi:1,4-alpha-glucan branching enzyme